MSLEIALSLVAASVPLAAIGLKMISMVSPVQFVKLETEFKLFRAEIRRDFEELKKALEKKNEQ